MLISGIRRAGEGLPGNPSNSLCENNGKLGKRKDVRRSREVSVSVRTVSAMDSGFVSAFQRLFCGLNKGEAYSFS